MATIGTLNEGSLHAALKALLAEPGDRFEVELDGFVVDLVRDDLLIEVQTRSIRSMRRKIDRLVDDHHIRIVHPIAVDTVIVRQGMADRLSPKHGSIFALFDELVTGPLPLDHPNLVLEIVLIDQEQVRVHDPDLRRRRGGWRTVDRRLTTVREWHRFGAIADLARLLPSGLPSTWTTADLASTAGISRTLAQRMAYTLRREGLITAAERTRAGIGYRTVGGPGDRATGKSRVVEAVDR